MVMNQNQFTMSTLKGSRLFGEAANVMTVELYNASATAEFVAGEFILLDSATGANSTPRAVKGTAVNDVFFGVILTNPLTESFYAGDRVEIGILGSHVLCEAAGAIAVGAQVSYDPTTKKVVNWVTGSPVPSKVGIALTKAAADGDLISVFVKGIY